MNARNELNKSLYGVALEPSDASDINPLSDAPVPALELLCCLSFGRQEVSQLLVDCTDDEYVSLLRCGALYRRLVEQAKSNAGVGLQINGRFSELYGEHVAHLTGLSVLELAEYWAKHRDSLTWTQASGLLWSISQRRGVGVKALQNGIIEHLWYAAAQSMATRCQRPCSASNQTEFGDEIELSLNSKHEDCLKIGW